jgi:hypothetical protein
MIHQPVTAKRWASAANCGTCETGLARDLQAVNHRQNARCKIRATLIAIGFLLPPTRSMAPTPPQ